MKVIFYVVGYQKEKNSKIQVTIQKNKNQAFKKFQELTYNKTFRVAFIEYYSKTSYKVLKTSENGVLKTSENGVVQL